MVNERGKKIILLVASPALFLVPFTGSSITVALPAMASQFNARYRDPWLDHIRIYRYYCTFHHTIRMDLPIRTKKRFFCPESFTLLCIIGQVHRIYGARAIFPDPHRSFMWTRESRETCHEWYKKNTSIIRCDSL